MLEVRESKIEVLGGLLLVEVCFRVAVNHLLIFLFCCMAVKERTNSYVTSRAQISFRRALSS